MRKIGKEVENDFEETEEDKISKSVATHEDENISAEVKENLDSLVEVINKSIDSLPVEDIVS